MDGRPPGRNVPNYPPVARIVGPDQQEQVSYRRPSIQPGYPPPSQQMLPSVMSLQLSMANPLYRSMLQQQIHSAQQQQQQQMFLSAPQHSPMMVSHQQQANFYMMNAAATAAHNQQQFGNRVPFNTLMPINLPANLPMSSPIVFSSPRPGASDNRLSVPSLATSNVPESFRHLNTQQQPTWPGMIARSNSSSSSSISKPSELSSTPAKAVASNVEEDQRDDDVEQDEGHLVLQTSDDEAEILMTETKKARLRDKMTKKSLKRSSSSSSSIRRQQQKGDSPNRSNKARKKYKKDAEGLNGEQRLLIHFGSYGKMTAHPQRIGVREGLGFIPDGIEGSFSMYGEIWDFSVKHEELVKCDDGFDRVCIRWTITNRESGKVTSLVESAADAKRRDLRGISLCNRVFTQAMELRAKDYDELAETETNSSEPNLEQAAIYRSRAQSLRPHRFSEGPLLFGLRHKSAQDKIEHM